MQKENSPVILHKNSVVKACAEVLHLVQGLVFFGLWVFFIYRAISWKGNRTLVSTDITPYIASDDSLELLPRGHQRSHFYIDKCDDDKTLDDRPRSYCKMAAYPKVYSTLNIEKSIWPGRVMDINYLLFTFCTVHALFNTSFLPFNLEIRTKSKYWSFLKDSMPKIILILFLFVAFIVFTILFTVSWGTELASLVIGFFFVFATLVNSFLIMLKERRDQKSVFRESIELGSVMRYYLARQCCTQPILLYVIFFEVYPFATDYTFVVIMILCGMTYLSFLFLENRIVYLEKKTSQQEHSDGKVRKFRVEKTIHFAVACFTTGTFFAYLFWATAFIDRVQIKFSSPHSERYAHMIYVIYKVIECFIFVLLYFCDQVDMLSIQTKKGK